MQGREAPFVIEVMRGGAVESRHLVSAAAVDREGRLRAGWGEIDAPVYPRSAIKPIQALPLVLTGAADAYGLSQAELALATGSHSGTARHVEVADAMRQRIGVEMAEIGCGAHPPASNAALAQLLAHGETASVLHNNCIGKHLGMIATARHLNEPVHGYLAPDHPVQRRIHALLTELGGAPLAGLPIGIDGCSAPTFALPLRALARGFATFGAPDGLEPGLALACRRIAAAMIAEPFMVAGEGRLSTELIAATQGAVLLKEGAEGVIAGVVPRKHLGFALKVVDGAGRAADVAALALLRYFGAIGHEPARRLRPRYEPVLRNWRGLAVGTIRPAGGWLPEGGS
ncbi:MAG: asparaginase [Alphaproteobacteria bacterium]